MRFRCDQCNAQYAIADEKVGDKGVRVRCKKCGHIITVRPATEQDEDIQEQATSEERADDLELQGTSVDQAPDGDTNGTGEKQRDATTVEAGDSDQNEDEDLNSGGFDVGDAELGSALDSVFGDTEKGGGEYGEDDEELDEEDDRDFDRQSTRVFNVEEMQKVQVERDEAAGRSQESEQISDLYESARASEEMDAVRGEGDKEPGAADSRVAAEPSDEDRERVEWYAAVDEQQVGPMSLTNLQERYEEGEFDAETLVWKTGFDDWLPIFELQELSFLTAASGKAAALGSAFQEDTDFEAPPSARDFAQEEGEGEKEEEEEGEGEEEDGMFEEEDAYSSAASAFSGQDVDWKPSSISQLDSLAEEELATLKPPPDPEPESDGLNSLFGAGEDDAEESSAAGTGDMDDGDSSIIGQIAAEEEESSKLAEEERQTAERAAEEARKKVEEDALAAQEAARREREAEQRERAAPLPENVLQARQSFPKWVVYGGFGLGGILVILLGFVAYELATGSAVLPGAGVAPVAGPAAGKRATAPVAKSAGLPAEPKPAPAGDVKPVAAIGSPVGSGVDKVEGQPAKSAVEKDASTSLHAGQVKSAGEKTTKTVAAVRHKPLKKRSAAMKKKKHKQEAATVIREDPEKEPSAQKKPIRHRKSSGGILDFDDENAFAKETGGAPVAKKEKPKEVIKELPPLSNADVLGVMRKHLAEFKACNRKQQEIDRSVKGKMVVKFIINPSGRVASVATETARFKKTFVSGCISKVIKQAHFPAFGGNPKGVPFPFTVK